MTKCNAVTKRCDGRQYDQFREADASRSLGCVGRPDESRDRAPPAPTRLASQQDRALASAWLNGRRSGAASMRLPGYAQARPAFAAPLMSS